MVIIVKEVENDAVEIGDVKNFLYDQIMKEYGIDPTPKFHYDIDAIEEYYILPSNSNFFIVRDGDEIVATAAVRPYDKDYEFFKDTFTKEDTASIWRLFVDEHYRGLGIASSIIRVIEDFARKENYQIIYLNTHRYLEAAIPFWKSLNYEILFEEDDYDETTHMVKYLI